MAEHLGGSGIGHQTRRDFLRKSLAAGAVLWAAPAVTTSRAAFAQSNGRGSPVPCEGVGPCERDAQALAAVVCFQSTTKTCHTWDLPVGCICAERVSVRLDQSCPAGSVFETTECGPRRACFVPCN